MKIHEYPIAWYTAKLSLGEHFSMGMYGDAEWLCVFKNKIGGRNAENTIYTGPLCDALAESLNYENPAFLFSTPEVLRTPEFADFASRIDALTSIEFVEKDCWDLEVRTGGLVDFIKQLQSMKTCVISNTHLRRLAFLGYDEFIEVSYPNCFDEVGPVVEQAIEIGPGYVYLISAGLPAALIAQRIQIALGDVFALDLGSIWDAFVGIGAQRGWRKEIYEDEAKYAEWKELYRECL